MIPVDLLGMIRKALKVSDSVLTFRPAILTSQGTKGQFKYKNQVFGINFSISPSVTVM